MYNQLLYIITNHTLALIYTHTHTNTTHYGVHTTHNILVIHINHYMYVDLKLTVIRTINNLGK